MIEKNVANDGELYNSLKTQLQNPNVMSFAFADYGRHIDMRNTDFGSPPFEEIKKWVKKEGLSKFKFVFKPAQTRRKPLNSWKIQKASFWLQVV